MINLPKQHLPLPCHHNRVRYQTRQLVQLSCLTQQDHLCSSSNISNNYNSKQDGQPLRGQNLSQPLPQLLLLALWQADERRQDQYSHPTRAGPMVVRQTECLLPYRHHSMRSTTLEHMRIWTGVILHLSISNLPNRCHRDNNTAHHRLRD